MGKYTTYMAIIHSYWYVYQRVYCASEMGCVCVTTNANQQSGPIRQSVARLLGLLQSQLFFGGAEGAKARHASFFAQALHWQLQFFRSSNSPDEPLFSQLPSIRGNPHIYSPFLLIFQPLLQGRQLEMRSSKSRRAAICH